MDIHLNVWGVKTKLDGNENVSLQLREIDSKDKIIGHLSRATALVLLDDLKKLLGARANEGPTIGQEQS
jgi:hypothetical protein